MKTLIKLLNHGFSNEDANALRKKAGVYVYFKENFLKSVDARAKEFNDDIKKLKIRIDVDDDDGEYDNLFFSAVTKVSMERMYRLYDKENNDPQYRKTLENERLIFLKKTSRMKIPNWLKNLKARILKPFQKINWSYQFVIKHLIRLLKEFKEYHEIKKIEKEIGVRRVFNLSVGKWMELTTEESFERARKIRSSVHLNKKVMKIVGF